jgi:hypothetical protein
MNFVQRFRRRAAAAQLYQPSSKEPQKWLETEAAVWLMRSNRLQLRLAGTAPISCFILAATFLICAL